ncbi:MAG: hypothetical protein FWB95_09755 [Treponema sp.]|nr:hypothetical protein [Treponema sp.]
MKKIILVGITVLFALALITCIDAPNGTNENTVPFVQYSADGTRVTINLDGYGDAESSRALSRPLTQETYNFLEVVFADDTSTARAYWERGKAMSITGVPRGTIGINYASTSAAGLTAGNGAAVLFVGRDTVEGYILMAIGKIVSVDGDDSSTTITQNTKSVTFGLAALQSTTLSAMPSLTGTGITPSLLTLTGGPATTPQITRFSLADDTTINATYAYTSSSTSFSIAAMLGACIAVNFTPSMTEGFMLKEPTILLPGNQTYGFEDTHFTSLVNGSIRTGASPLITFSNAIPAAGIPIQIVVPSGATGVNSFSFAVPVNALNEDDGVGSPVVPPRRWLLRPGIDVMNIDTSSGGTNSNPNSPGSYMFISAGTIPTPGDELAIKIR